MPVALASCAAAAPRAMPPRQVITLDVAAKLGEAVALLKERGSSQVPSVAQGALAGILTEADVLRRLLEGHATAATSLAEVMHRKVSTVGPDYPAGELPAIFERGEVALVVDDDRQVVAVLTKMDLIEMLASRRSGSR